MLCLVQSCAFVRHNQFHMTCDLHACTHARTQNHARAHQAHLIARLWKIIKFPLIKSRFHAICGPILFLAGKWTTVQSVLLSPQDKFQRQCFGMGAVSRSEWSYINERGVLSLFYKGLRVIWGIHLFAFGRCWLPATATILFSFFPDLTLTLLTHFGLCVFVFVCAEATQPVPDQPNKIKICFTESLFTSLSPLLLSLLPFHCSTHSHAQLPRRRGPLPGDARWRKWARPLPEGQREPGGQAPREDVPGTDGEGRGRKEAKGINEDYY